MCEERREQFSRTENIIGYDGLKRLEAARVAVFGIGGVGGYVCEALVRSGIGAIDLIDSDNVCLSNLNRQIIATRKTIGMPKVLAMKERIMDINPDVRVTTWQCFYLPENEDQFPFESYDYIVDAVDTVTAKISLVMKAKEMNIPIISSMGAGNKLDGSCFKVADIYKTNVCPLARVMRRELKARGVKHLKVVYSEEQPIIWNKQEADNKASVEGDLESKKSEKKGNGAPPGSVAFVPSVAGLIAAGEVIKDLISMDKM